MEFPFHKKFLHGEFLFKLNTNPNFFLISSKTKYQKKLADLAEYFILIM